ncbi:MAG: hypothetical protein A3C90_00600 [Candidatus Magasanikbacteria bacterium RIFCSPHIGHO2_02_FULL_51_14]|uniref:EamA domain-containing protein n=1 Tax=Candidatus Magasanikbacteria bacterium RIFCSPHIGHO2_02_FULL_51_14 TaxID=1798683 RepID=A0A1F6MFJ6_9BACT|nr:MAG: hypothetical protein A3C90_00600 [Candidatus Magasanikbacteria bacterium RIFCSPHIGHO2_02_FULL_51_14]
MLWFPLALLGYFLLAIAFILDKFILTKSVREPAVYAFYSTIFLFGVLLAWPFGVELLATGFDWAMAVFSGVTFGFALWTLYIAVKGGEATHVNPFNGAIVTAATFVLSSAFLAESLTELQIAGVVILLFASVLLMFEKSFSHSGFHIGFLWAALSGVLFAMSHVSAKYLYEVYSFLTGFVWSRAAIGLVGLFLLAHPAVWRSFKRKKDEEPRASAKRYAVPIVVANKALGLAAVILVQYAAAIGFVTLVVALSGIQYVLMFVLAYVLTKTAPKFFQEYFTKRELAVQVVAILLVAIGSAMLVL